jgi:thiamine biosynthesis protein ThiS
MKITLNNNEEVLEGSQMSISELLEVKKYSFKMLVIKVNDAIVKRDAYPTTFIKEGDDVLVLHLMSGG